jgi:23S rRNA (uridine2552-2'-O)-methyltransferase
MDPVPGATVIQGDFQDDAVAASGVVRARRNRRLVLSDMAPNTTGHGATDHLRIIALAELALDTALAALSPAGVSSPRFSRAAASALCWKP